MLSESTTQGQLRRTTSEASLILPPEIAAQIIAHAQTGYPKEVCGLVAGAAGRATTLYPGCNISPTPHVAYELDHDTLARIIDFEDAGLELLAIYHSHPGGPAFPSPVDIEQAYYPKSIYLICNLANPVQPVLHGFRIEAGRFRKVRLDTPYAIG